MLIECSHCGAPLDVKPNDSLARCQYCGKTQRVRTARTTMQQTPPNWHPPPQWTPPQHFRAPSVPLRLDQSKTVRKIIIWIVLFSVVTGIVPIVCVTCAVVGSVVTSVPPRSSPPATPRSDDIESPQKGKKKRSKTTSSCKQADACCRIAMPGGDTKACDSLVEANNAKACMEALRAFKQAAEAQGRTCD